jgi:N-acetylglucosaminyldiphosphoundecaprenol N-acetyl-beta-D-mannosaminyltransferase
MKKKETDDTRTSVPAPRAGASALQPAVLGNVPLHRVDLHQAADLIAAWARAKPFRLIVTPNVDHVIQLQRNPEFRAAYDFAALSLVDGKPVQWAAGYLGLGRFEKVSGSDLAPELLNRAAAAGLNVFFVGGRSAEELRFCLDRIIERHPGLVAGGHCPPFGFENDPTESARLLKLILRFETNILMFGCGAPKSEIWMHRFRGQLGRGVGIGTGASIRFMAGVERRAPQWMQRAGLEWAWRMAGDPRRLAKRYLIDDLKFFPLVWRWKRNRKP